MEVKVVVSIDDRTASLLENLIDALGSKIVQKTASVAPQPAGEDKVVEEKGKSTKKVISEPKETKESGSTKPIGLEDIRAIARQLADAGRQAEYREILKDCGYEKVNQIQEKDYLRIYTEMLTLVDGDPF